MYVLYKTAAQSEFRLAIRHQVTAVGGGRGVSSLRHARALVVIVVVIVHGYLHEVRMSQGVLCRDPLRLVKAQGFLQDK